MQKLLTTILFCASAFVQAQDAKEILLKALAKCDSIEKGYYEMEEYYSQTSKTEFKERRYFYKSHFKNNENDSLYGASFCNETYLNDTLIVTSTNSPLSFSKYYKNKDTGFFVDKSKMYLAQYAGPSQFETRYTPIVGKNHYPIPPKHWIKSRSEKFTILGKVVLNNTDTCYQIEHFRKHSRKSIFHSEKLMFWVKTDDFIPIKYERQILRLENKDSIWNVSMKRILNYSLDDNYLLDSAVFNPKNKIWFPKLGEFKAVDRTGLAMGSIPPNWKLETVSSDSIELNSLKGKVVLLDFFFINCPPCRESIPHLKKLQEEYGGNNFVLIGLNPFDKKEKLTEFRKEQNLTYSTALSSKEISKMYKVTGYPTVYILNKKGEIIYHFVGYSAKANKKMKKVIKKAIKAN